MPVERDYRAGRAACIAMMKPEVQAAVEAFYTDEDNQKALAWKSKFEPNLTDAQIAAAATAKKSAPRKK